MPISDRQLAAVKAALFLLCLVPLARLGWDAWRNALGPNPIEAIQRGLGLWTLNLLVITLCVTPLRRLSGWAWLVRLRRMLGLYAFFYAALHFANYLWLDQFFDWNEIGRDILKRPFITVGFAAFVLLLPLAATSNRHALRRLGGRRWQALHRSIYPIAILAVIHYWWLVKRDVATPALYAIAVLALLGLRALWRDRERREQLAGKYAPQQPPRVRGRIIPIVSQRK
ncbi:sulfite oxidase heme-binding subunit YedZ [Sulfurisoma sediminicola]|uniref:Protein-methionine-sulfoxide reductase heme-binding subunit MsrQ n=1 Tax=Sulfurisoma sediminicola TaxID=1381557 RepID=A0A497XIS1_9PROT|nr:protein-methionine-sulfoxide reductase heme-binding subunit MsrQ [Sulfurisoma sediminicola]RLJ67793.1 sulfoxide reductase heme-binding subunit YedZ [Sulfurisoma sediminicola]